MAHNPPAIDLQLLEEAALELFAWESLDAEWPLAMVKLWHQEGQHDDAHFMVRAGIIEADGTPCTSQLTLVQQLALYRTILGSGGNRSGKTFGIMAASVAVALGSDHPAARQFWLNNGIDPTAFPTGPANATHNDGEVWFIAVSYQASKEYHRDAVEKLLTPGTFRWLAKDANAPAELRIDCPGYDYPAKIRFKADGSGRDNMQGARCRLIWSDEEGPDAEVWDECGTRLVDLNGWHILTNTPLAGKTWVYDRLVEKTSEDAELDCVVYEIWGEDNPHLSLDGYRKLARGNAALKAAKTRGQYVERQGRVYSTFSRNVHVVQPFEIPHDWLRFRSVDFGTRNPFVNLWGALDGDDRLFIFREHYQAERTLAHHAAAIRTAEGWVKAGDGWARPDDGAVERIEMSWADPEDAQQLMSLNIDHDLGFAPALKAVLHGIDVVSERLDPLQEGGPALFIFADCVHTIRELEGYSWADGSSKTDPADRPKKKNDHCPDALRYMCVGIRIAT